MQNDVNCNGRIIIHAHVCRVTKYQTTHVARTSKATLHTPSSYNVVTTGRDRQYNRIVQEPGEKSSESTE